MPGDDLLFHRLSDSTIGAVGFHGRVRDGIGWDTDAIATRQWSGRMRGLATRPFGLCGIGGWVSAGLKSMRALTFSWECIIRIMQPKVVIDGV